MKNVMFYSMAKETLGDAMIKNEDDFQTIKLFLWKGNIN